MTGWQQPSARRPAGAGLDQSGGADRIVARDEATGFPVIGDVVERADGSVAVRPVGPAYPSELVVGEPLDDDPGERWYAIWDIVCLVLAGGLEQLPPDTLAFIAEHINQSHI